ncbi:hypothetical protein UCMB321_4536 [Pseudomonas batumici]|uniref:Uncharacterized protein n=1 Tax=Pseudomonas batumici TaxID=226910 RepID=A0A0C2ETJ7_9PSED|nr:hypothetical protein UCMB321_4536 [Pseudomonas batumici]
MFHRRCRKRGLLLGQSNRHGRRSLSVAIGSDCRSESTKARAGRCGN